VGKGVSASERTNDVYHPPSILTLRCFAASLLRLSILTATFFIHLILHVREIYYGLDSSCSRDLLWFGNFMFERFIIDWKLHVREIYCGFGLYFHLSNLSTYMFTILTYSSPSILTLRDFVACFAGPFLRRSCLGPLFYHLLVSTLIILTYYRLAVLSVGRNRSHNHL